MATATPTATAAKPKGADAKAASAKAPDPKAEPLKLKPEPRQHELRGFGAFVKREILRNAAYRPDHSHEGFVIALRAGIQFVAKKNWNTAGYMLEELEHQIRRTLRVPDGVWCDFVGSDKETNFPRILCLTSWGFREAVEGQISFKLYTTDRPLQPAEKG